MRLRPLTIGHRALLSDIRSPFATVSDSISRKDLLNAVLICSQPYPEALRLFSGGLSWRVGMFLCLWGFLARKCSLARETEAFMSYWQAQQAFPPVRPHSGEGRTLRAPEDWRLILFLRRVLGLTVEQSLNFPVLRAHALWLTDAEREGSIELACSSNPFEEARANEFREWCEEQDKLIFGAN